MLGTPGTYELRRARASVINKHNLGYISSQYVIPCTRKHYFAGMVCSLSLWNDLENCHLATSSCQRSSRLIAFQKLSMSSHLLKATSPPLTAKIHAVVRIAEGLVVPLHTTKINRRSLCIRSSHPLALKNMTPSPALLKVRSIPTQKHIFDS